MTAEETAFLLEGAMKVKTCLACPFCQCDHDYGAHEQGVPYCSISDRREARQSLAWLPIRMDGDNQAVDIPDWCPLPLTVERV